MNVLPLIEAKRDGHVLVPEQLCELIFEYAQGRLPDYQMAAWLMAVFFRGMNREETRALTIAMRDSGERLEFPVEPRPVVDKHSTGGVGDKVSLPLAPLLACLGFRVPMISGRGLGITGGTLDKLESIPGFRTRFSAPEIISLVQQVGCVICGQSDAMCPADRGLYALRDATGTVPSIPLITASILSKKLSEGIQALILDVKFGSAAFMKTQPEALELARAMIDIAAECGVKARALLTDMNSPIGHSAGNWLEVKESLACLENRGPADLRELVVECAAQLLVLSGKSSNPGQARAASSAMLQSGKPRRKWDEMLLAQGADLEAFNARVQLDSCASVVRVVRASRAGYVAGCDARAIGEVVRDLGAGRMTRESPIDFHVGLDQMALLDMEVRQGDVLCRVHARSGHEADAAAVRLHSAFTISDASTSGRAGPVRARIQAVI